SQKPTCRSYGRWASPASSGRGRRCRRSSSSCAGGARPVMLDDLLRRFRQHDRRALSRLLTLLANGEKLEEILAAVEVPGERSRVVAVTGSGGVGKSTLVGKLIESFRAAGQTVAVLACDPESPLTGGALLGDRFRMAGRPEDDGVFIRSLAAASGRGALAA